MQASNFSRSFAGALVSFGRLDKYFSTAVPLVKYPTGPLRLEKACLRRNKKATFSLEDVSLDFVEGGLNVLAGPSGSGKSTLLLGILGETYLEGGRVTRPDDVAYASQSSWLQNESIKENILFGSPMDQTRYDRIIEACCLGIDFKEIDKGENAMVGENGTALSGGQKARVALARALYCNAPLLLLDDIFAALDAKTAAGVWKYCFCSDLLKGRTTVLVTNVPWIAAQADLAIILDKGEIKSVEPNIGVVRTPITIAQVLGGNADEAASTEEQQEGDTETGEDPQQAKADPLNDVSKVAEPEAGKDGNIVDQEAKASGKIGRLTCTLYT
jgi:ABC-type multidrug transport system fused ATPase/permease subunit